MSESSNSAPTRDFTFVLRSPTVLMKAVDTLSNHTFNKKQQGILQVGESGFEITVEFIDKKMSNKIDGYLRFKATELEEFQCNNPLQKMVSLKSIRHLLKDAFKTDHGAVTIFSVCGSKKLFFQWGQDFGYGFPISIELNDVKPEQRKFPTVVNYGSEAVIPSNILKDALTKVLQLRKQPTGRIYWKSLRKATLLADKCSMHLTTNPPQYVMLQFKLEELGDLVYLIQAQFLHDNTFNGLRFPALFRALKIRRFFTRKKFG